MVSWTLVVHVFGIVFWIGGLLMTTVLLAQHAKESSPEARAALTRMERKSLRMMTDPGALLTLAAGITLIFTNKSYYLHAAWLHFKLLFVVILIGLHGYIGVTAKGLQTGKRQITPGQAWLLFALVLAVFVSILIVTLPGEVYLLR
jgi:putative membrane protein